MGSRFTFWLDEILWSQGRVAVELIEEILWQLGGRRTGGPLKKLPPQAVAAAAAAADFEPGTAAGQLTSPGKAAAAVGGNEHHHTQQQQEQQQVAGAVLGSSEQQQQQHEEEPWRRHADAAALGLATRADEHLLGFCHPDKWQFLWTKSVYGIKAARGMQQGQVVSAIAGLNSLTMKKKMIITIKQVRGVLCTMLCCKHAWYKHTWMILKNELGNKHALLL